MYIRPYGNPYKLIATNLSFAKSEVKAGVRHFRLRAEPVTQTLDKDIQLEAWGV